MAIGVIGVPLVDRALLERITEEPVLLRTLHYVRESMVGDMGHDFSHICRVLSNAWEIHYVEGGDASILIAAVLLHDIKNYPKGHPKAKSSSSVSARVAGEFLLKEHFPREKIGAVQDAIVCHSFSKGLVAKTLEGKILQDADRLDALGAVGIARVFAVAGSRGAEVALYNNDDPLGHAGREHDDGKYVIDHFFTKLFRLPALMHTAMGREIAEQRVALMRQYLEVLEREVDFSLERHLSMLDGV